ncbi:hypothetical protein BJY04DRAFT_213239 [Aspergillus karnatakaensis]|uniref:uncharacterized protein n=1 Tax=Aspergillus karnatakaensis TaxID=1810916 RepID=UPI003CCD70A0
MWCDLARPFCGQCRKSSLVCDGYDRSTIWVNMTRETGPDKRYTLPPQPSEITLAETLARTAYQEQYLGLFWNEYLPNGRALPVDSQKYTGGSAAPLKKVLLAIALASVGKRDRRNRWMVEGSVKLHGEAMAAVAGQLGEMDVLSSDLNLASVRLLWLYEILHGHDLQDHQGQVRKWHTHIKGGMRFLLSRGPENYTSGFAHQLFADDRNTQIASALVSGTHSILNTPEWKTIPWSITPKTPKDILGDIFAEIPTLFVELNLLRSCSPDEDYRHRETLIRHCWRLEKQWLNWILEHAPACNPIIPDPESVSPSQVFEHFIAAHAMIGYWTIGVLVYGVFQVVCGYENEPRELGLGLEEGLYETDARRCCARIMEILPTFLHPYTGEYGMHGAIFPAIVVLDYHEEWDGEGSKVEREIEKLFDSCSKGRRIGEFVYGMRVRLRAGGLRLFKPVYE